MRDRFKIRLFAGLLMIMLLLSGPAHGTETTADHSEADVSGLDSAECRVAGTYSYPGFEVVQFNLAVLSHYSYMVVSDGQALVVDPIRDPFAYLDYAMKQNLRIAGVYLTHDIVDFVAGHIELSDMNTCPIYVSGKSEVDFKHKSVKNGSKISIGQAVITIWETPGPGPENTCGVLSAQAEPDKPLAILSGNTLLAGGVGRPNLSTSQAAASTLASMMYDTWTEKLSKLPDEVNVHPGCGAGSLCEIALYPEPVTTIGVQRRTNPFLQHPFRGGFMAAFLENLPRPLPYFRHNDALNRKGPPKVDWNAPLPEVKALHPELANTLRYYVVDLREPREYAAGHIPGSVNIGLRGRFETFVGTMVPWLTKLILCGSEPELEEAMQRLNRVGYEAKSIVWDSWKKSNLPIVKSSLIKARELHRRMQKKDSPLVVDVRLPNEMKRLRIGTVLNLPLDRLEEEAALLAADQKVVTVCDSTYHSSLALGVLERKGFKNVSALDGGTRAWIDAGLPIERSEIPCEASFSPGLSLPRPISAVSLDSKVKDRAGTFELVDIRPPKAFADYHIPGSINRDISEVTTNPDYLEGDLPLIIVDRDGSLAMAVGGILASKSKRKIEVLQGGLEAFWRETVLEPAVKAMPMDPGAPPKIRPKTRTAPAPAPLAPTAPPQKPKSKSAGC